MLPGGERRDLLVHRGQGVHFAARGLGFPGGEPLRRGGFGRAGLPGDGAARLALVRRVFCPACWCSSHSVRRDGGLPCTAWYSRASRSSSPVTATAREENRSITSWLTPPTSAPLPSARGTMAYPSADSLVSRIRSATGATAEPLVVQGARVQRPPLVVGAVGALDPVPDRHVHVQLRVAVAGQVVQEQAGDQAVAVAPLPRAGRMVPGAGVGGVPLQPGDGFARGVHQRGLDLVGAGVERGGLVLVAALAGLAGGDPVGGVQHRHALDRADGQVEVRHAVRVLAALGGADLGQLGRAGVRVRGQVRRDRGGLAILGRLGLPALDQELPAGPDVLLVQALNDVRVHRAGSARALRRPSRPIPRAVPRPRCSRTWPRRSRRGPGRR